MPRQRGVRKGKPSGRRRRLFSTATNRSRSAPQNPAAARRIIFQRRTDQESAKLRKSASVPPPSLPNYRFANPGSSVTNQVRRQLGLSFPEHQFAFRRPAIKIVGQATVAWRTKNGIDVSGSNNAQQMTAKPNVTCPDRLFALVVPVVHVSRGEKSTGQD